MKVWNSGWKNEGNVRLYILTEAKRKYSCKHWNESLGLGGELAGTCDGDL